MSRGLFQIIAGCGFALAAMSLWAGFGGLASIAGGPSTTVTADWTPDLKPLDLEGDTVLSNASFPETLARPLFSPTRKPPEPRPPEPVAVAPPQPMEPTPPPQTQAIPTDGFVLKGVFINDKRQLALLQTPSSPQGVWLATGARVEGWTVTLIEKQAIAIEANGQVQKLTLYVDKPAN
ncbi:MAG: hypothetical protein AB7F74_08320 [Parvibaculaceae bacterium]